MSAFNEMLSFGEASEIWGLESSTLRKAVAAGKLVAGEDCRKFGKQWVVLVSAMAREYRGYTPWNEYKERQGH